MAPHSGTLAWTIPWTEEPGRLQGMESWRVRQDWATCFSLSTFMHWRGNGNPLQCSCLENPRDGGAWWAAVYGVSHSQTQWSGLVAAAAYMKKSGFPCGSAGKESTCNAGDLVSIPGWGRSPGEGKVYPLQYSGHALYKPCGCKESDMTEWLSQPLLYMKIRKLMQPLLKTVSSSSLILLLLFFFYLRVIAFQNFVVFFQTSTWISHMYTYIPSFRTTCPLSPSLV